MKRSRLERKTPLENKTPMKRRGFIRKRGGKWKRDRERGSVFGALSDFVRRGGCQAKAWAPGPCSGKVEACHARARGMGGGRGDWIREPGGAVVGNVFGGCTAHHAYSDLNKENCLLSMRAAAFANGREAVAQGIEPVL